MMSELLVGVGKSGSTVLRSRAARRTENPRANTARTLEAVWVAVQNVDHAAKQLQSMGFALGSKQESPALGANGQEVVCGNGKIVLWQPSRRTSPLSTLIENQGLGPFGFEVEVADLKRAKEIVEHETGTRMMIRARDSKNSFIVPGNLAAGAWIEFFQK